MRLLNEKSILDCDEYDEEQHNEEIEEIQNRLYDLPDYDCAIVFKYIDMAHKGKNDKIKSCTLHDCFEMIEYADIKNGIDVMLNDEGLLTFIAHGQGYTYEGEYGMVTTAIIVMPYDKNKETIDISYVFDDALLIQENSICLS